MSTKKSSERTSRRSSILKPPKSRQPLQNVELNASSAENSPTMSMHKIKRRVSFAEKKHVKEFCDSMEQGTVWDSTYEESELSHRNSQNSNDENTATVDLPNESSKSHPRASVASETTDELIVRKSTFTGLKFRHSSSSSTENPSTSDLNPTPAACDPTIEDSVFGTALTRIPYPTNHFESIKARRSLSVSDCFAERNAFEEKSSFRARADSCPAAIDPRTRQTVRDDLSNLEAATEAGEDCNDVVPMEETTIADVSVEPRPYVETVPGSTRASIIALVDEHAISDAPKILSTGPMVESKLDEEIPRLTKISVEHEKFTIFHDTSMEITEAVSNFAKLHRPAKPSAVESREESYSVAAEITTFGTKTMEFDAPAIESAEPMVDSKLDEKVARIAKNSVEHEKCTIFHDTSMEITEAVSNFARKKSSAVESRGELDEEIARIAKNSVEHEKFTIFHDTSMEITEAVSNFAKKKSSAVESRGESSLVTAESSMIGSKTLEFTEAVCKTVGHPSFNEFVPRERDLLREKSICHGDKSMDFTEVVRTTPSSGQSPDSPTERTKIFEEKSVDFTGIVGNVAGIENPRKSLMERTKIFEDKSVDFTDIVGNAARIENPRKSPTERTRLFHDKSMEFTDAVGNVRITEGRQKSPTERTKIFHDKSMEFTDAVGNVRIMEQQQKLSTERTKIFHDEAVDFTEVVGKVAGTENPRKLPTERTKIFHDESIDFTEVVGKVAGIESHRKSPTESTKIFHDKSMEFTEAVENVRITKERQKSPTERTKIFHNECVDFTEVVGNVPDTENLRKSQTERTTLFLDKSMEFTKSVENIRITKEREKSPTERTKIFHNECVDFTEVVGNVPNTENLRKSQTERTTLFHDKSMEFTDAVQNVRIAKQLQTSPTERTKIFHNECVDFTEVVGNVPNAENLRKSPTERTTLFHDKSMEFTESVENIRIAKQRQKSPTERTKIFHNESVDFTEVVRNVPSRDERTNRESPPGRSTMFHNFPDFPEIVPGVRSAEKPLPDDPPPARSSIFCDQSEVEFHANIQKLRHEESLEQPEPEERNILQNRQPRVVPEVLQKILRAPKLGSRESTYALDARMAIVAKTFVPAVQKPRSEDPEPEIRSPLPKRMKSIGNKSTDLTAAVSFIKMGGNKKQPSDDESTPEAIDERFSEKPTNFRNESMEVTEVVAESFPGESHSAPIFLPPSAEEIPIFQNKSAETTFALPGSADCDDDSYRLRNTTLLNDESMEITGVIPGIVRAENTEIQENPKTIFHDQSMEMTMAASRLAFPRTVPTSSETRLPDNGEARSIVFRDNSMELTGAVRPASSAKEQIYANENNAVHWSDPSKFGPEGKTVLFHDDRMELTGAVGFNARTEALFVDKENCPIGAEDIRPRGVRLFEHESRIAGSKGNNSKTRTTVFRDDSMDLTGVLRPALNSKERKCVNQDETVHWSDPSKFDHDGKTVLFRDDRMELTGAVGFNSRAEAPFLDKENCPIGAEDFRPRGARLFEDESRIAFKSEWLGKRKSFRCSSSQGNEEKLRGRPESDEQNRIENCGSDDVTGVVAFSSQIDDNEYGGDAEERDYRISGNDSGTLILGNESLQMTGVAPWSSDLDVNRQSRPAGGTDDLPIVHKIHQRSSQSQVVKELFQKPISNEIYGGEKIEPVSVNERTGTADLEAEIRKLAKSFALEDESGFDQATFLRQQARCMEDYEANSTASQDCEPPAQSARADRRSASDESSDSGKSDDWERSPDMKRVNSSGKGRGVSAADSQCFSSKSLEELRNRAYSVGKFQPEATEYELTAAISMPSSDDFHRTIMLEDLQAVEPPSFLGDLADSVRSARSISELPSASEVGGKTADSEMRRDGEAISRTWEDLPNASLDTELMIPDITETVNMEGIVEERRYENSGERMERKKIHRMQTCEMKKPIYDARISASASEIDDERAKNHRRSSTGLTTADEFSSESADGPSEKLRRGESVLPIDGKVEKSTKFTGIDRSWDSTNFASSTVIVDDFKRQTMHRFIEETSVVLESSLSDELPSVVDANEEENVGRSVCAEEAAGDVMMEAEASLCKSPFDALQETIKNLAGRSETIWTIIRFDEKMLAVNFFSNSIVLAIHFNEMSDANTNHIKVIEFLSQLIEDGTDPGVSLAHSLIMKKVDSSSLTRSYRTYEDIPQMLEFVTTEVKLGMDFMFELDHLRNRNVMEIYGNRIIFMVRTSDINAGIILKLTMEIKPFAEINSNDITISYILGSDKVRETDIKRLITNIKRDHRFLRFYMNDVKDYVDLMAETGFSASSGTGCD